MWLILPALILVLAILSAFIISTDFSTLSNALSLSRSPLPHSLIEYQRYLIDYYSDHYPLYSKLVFSTNVLCAMKMILVKNSVTEILHQDGGRAGHKDCLLYEYSHLLSQQSPLDPTVA